MRSFFFPAVNKNILTGYKFAIFQSMSWTSNSLSMQVNHLLDTPEDLYLILN